MKTAALFPGQGSQYPGMAKVLKEQFPWTKEYYEEASEAVKEDLLRLCLEGPADKLTLTENQQPCILVTSYAWFQVIVKSLDFRPVAGAGHSLGEYSALAAAGAMTLTEAARLVRTRGQLMQTAVPAGKGKMAAVIGLADEQVEELCRLATEGDHSLVVPANFNAPSQVVVAGHAGAVDRLIVFAASDERPELKARKVIPLNVSAPFHCPLMKPVADQFMAHLESANWQKPAFPVANNLDGKLRQEAAVAPLLRDQIDHPVKWTSCAKTLADAGVTRFVEMGPGKILIGLVKRIVEKTTLHPLDTYEDFKALEKALQG